MCYSQAWNIIGESPWSEEASFMTQATVPSAPEALSCTADGATTVLVAWQEPADGGAPINAYQLQMDDGEGGDFQLLYNGNVFQHLAANLRSGLGYRFRVLAENEVGLYQSASINIPHTTNSRSHNAAAMTCVDHPSNACITQCCSGQNLLVFVTTYY